VGLSFGVRRLDAAFGFYTYASEMRGEGIRETSGSQRFFQMRTEGAPEIFARIRRAQCMIQRFHLWLPSNRRSAAYFLDNN
jgi:hypothetical protein